MKKRLIMPHWIRNGNLTPVESPDGPSIYLVHWMSYDKNGDCVAGLDRNDFCMIGIYGDRQAAAAAVGRARLRPGFRDYPHNFKTDRFVVNADSWTSGFALVSKKKAKKIGKKLQRIAKSAS